MKSVFIIITCCLAFAAGAIASSARYVVDSVPDQKLVVFEDGIAVARYPVSTSKFGLGDRPGSYATPLGRMQVASKIGSNARPGTVFKSRRPTGEVLRPNAPGRDPIVTRIIWLRGLESRNRNAFGRTIYIHGTPQERLIGRRASYGCVRMTSRDVISLYKRIGVGDYIEIVNKPIRGIIGTMAERAAQGRISG